MRVSSTASAKCCGSREKPGASSSIACGVNSSASASSTSFGGEQQRENAIGEQLRRLGAAFAANARIGRNEGGVKRAFREDRAKMIGQP